MANAGDGAWSEVYRLLEVRAGLDPESLGSTTVQHAVRKRMTACDCSFPRDYLRRLLLDNVELQELLEDLVVPETWFFRDPAGYLYLGKELEGRRLQAGHEFRVLTIPCSTGEETYSVAMILRDADLDPAWFRVLGADLSTRAIAKAQTGIYAARSFREGGERFTALRDCWCEQVKGSWRVRGELRRGVEFCSGNIARPGFLPDEGPFDVIFCRNLLIYFHAESRRTALRHLDRLLKPSGLLFCTPAEARIVAEAGFCRLDRQSPFLFGRPAEVAQTPQLATTPQPIDAKEHLIRSPSPSPSSLRRSSAKPRCISLDPTARVIAQRQMPGAPQGAAPGSTSELELLQAARQAADQGRLEQADSVCGQVLAGNPSSTEAFFLRGVVRQSQGALSEAQHCFERVLYLNPRHYEALVHVMLVAEQRGERLLADNYRRRIRENARGDDSHNDPPGERGREPPVHVPAPRNP